MRREFDYSTVGSAQNITATNVRRLTDGKRMTSPASAPVRVIVKRLRFPLPNNHSERHQGQRHGRGK
jgi:hypothetical protein